MEKKQFVALLYVFWIVPMMYAVSNNFLSNWWRVWFGILNIVALIIFAIVFTPNNTPVTNRKKKTSLLILLWLLSISLVIGTLVKFSEQASYRLYNNALAPSTTTIEDTIQSGNTLSWTTWEIVSIDLITWSIDINNLNSWSDSSKPEYPKPTVTTGTVNTDTFEKKDTNPSTTEESTITTVLPNKGTLNYSQVIPYLVSKYNLKSWWKSTTFTNITTSNALYNSFNIAASKGMIGWNINPASKVSCNTYLVLKGIAAWWKVEYKAWDPFWPYRTAAYNKWEINWCTAGSFVTKATL